MRVLKWVNAKVFAKKYQNAKTKSFIFWKIAEEGWLHLPAADVPLLVGHRVEELLVVGDLYGHQWIFLNDGE